MFTIVNMRSPSASQAGPDADITARARIRDAAILRFARDGFSVGLRAIAEDAGVSAALIVRHFGSKDALRAECDGRVLAMLRERKGRILTVGGMENVLLALASMDESAPLLGYALRSLQAGGVLAMSFVDQFAADAEVYCAAGVAAGTMLPSRDEKARARYLTVQGFGALILDMTLNPPADPTDLVGIVRGYMTRMGLPSIELFSQGLMADRTMLDAYLLYVGGGPSPTGNSGNPPREVDK